MKQKLWWPAEKLEKEEKSNETPELVVVVKNFWRSQGSKRNPTPNQTDQSQLLYWPSQIPLFRTATKIVLFRVYCSCKLGRLSLGVTSPLLENVRLRTVRVQLQRDSARPPTVGIRKFRENLPALLSAGCWSPDERWLASSWSQGT